MPDALSLGITLGVIAIQAVWFVCLGLFVRRHGTIPKGLCCWHGAYDALHRSFTTSLLA